MKGIILAGGSGSRLYPLTLTTSKQLLPVFDKPMIYYPLSLLMQAKIKDILIICLPRDLKAYETLFGDGSSLGLNISYVVQDKPDGIAQAFVLGESFIARDSVCLVLGDNVFFGHHLESLMQESSQHEEGALVFGYEVRDPSRYGVIDFDENYKVKKVVEKPKDPPSNYAVTGLYFYDEQVASFAKQLKPSHRGELEITDLNQMYLEKDQLRVRLLDRGFAWLDTGTHDSLHKASSYVQTIQERQGVQIACIEEIAYRNGWINLAQLEVLANRVSSSDYGAYLIKFLEKSHVLCKN